MKTIEILKYNLRLLENINTEETYIKSNLIRLEVARLEAINLLKQ